MAETADPRPLPPASAARAPAAGGGAGVARARLAFEAGNSGWLLPLEDSGEVLPVPTIERVPLTRSWFLGAANVRGVIYGVTDWAAFVGAGPSARGPENRLLLIGQRFALNVALLVARVGGLRSVAELAPAAARADLPWAHRAWRDAQGMLWQELDAGVLLQRTDFLEVARAEAARHGAHPARDTPWH